MEPGVVSLILYCWNIEWYTAMVKRNTRGSRPVNGLYTDWEGFHVQTLVYADPG